MKKLDQQSREEKLWKAKEKQECQIQFKMRKFKSIKYRLIRTQ